jgi:hypothetical protein
LFGFFFYHVGLEYWVVVEGYMAGVDGGGWCMGSVYEGRIGGSDIVFYGKYM